MKEQLLTKIEGHSAVIAVIGLGYVGLPLAVAFAERGFPVVGIDVDATKVAALNRGESYVQDIPSARLEGIRLKVDGRDFEPSTINLPTPRHVHCHHRLQRPGAVRRGDHLRADAAEQDARPGCALHHLLRRVFGAAYPSRHGGRVGIDDLSGHDRGAAASDVGAERSARGRAISSWPFRRSASIRATRSTWSRTRPKWSAARPPRAAMSRWPSTRRSSSGSCRFPRRRRPRWSSCSKTPSAP